MSRRRPTNQPQVQLTHPNDDTIRVTVQKPTRIAGIKLGQVIASATRALVIYDKDNNPALDKDGEPRVFLQQNITLEAILANLKENVVGWDGIFEDKGDPIPFKADKVGILLEDWLDCEVEHPATDKQPAGKVTMAFSRWINDRINDPKTFTSDPFENVSAKP